jgi:hypothetical protein
MSEPLRKTHAQHGDLPRSQGGPVSSSTCLIDFPYSIPVEVRAPSALLSDVDCEGPT